MQDQEPGNEPGETIGVSDNVTLEIRELSDGGPRAVLFVDQGFEAGQAVDIEIVQVDADTLAEITRKRT